MSNNINIVKRNGKKEVLDITKIQKMTFDATLGLEGVSQSELEVDSQIKFIDGMSSSDIQDALIKTAVEKIDIDVPNWTFVASRLFLYDLYHRVNINTLGRKVKNGEYPTLKQYIKTGIEASKLVPNLASGYDLEDLNFYLKPERDLLFNYLGIKTLYDRYLIKNSKGEPIELPQQMFMAIAMFLAQNEDNKQEKAKEFYDVISKFEVMLATPTLSNARTNRHQLSSCYIGSSPDNIEGIFDGYKEMALLSKYGGGIGWDWNQIRSLGGAIDGHSKVAGGTVPFLKVTNDIAIAVDQLGTRKGAIAVYLEPWHLDIMDFIDLKKNSGEERRRAHDLFPALWISDLFMERVLEDSHWTLFDPVEVKDLSECFGKEFEDRYIAYENDDSITKSRIKAKDLWKKILTSYFESGSPFLCFKDSANKANPNQHIGHIRSSNLCVTGDTKLLTKEGYKEIGSIVDTIQTVWNGKEWSEKVNIVKTSEGQKVVKVIFDNYTEISATEYHKWYIQEGYGDSNVIEKRTHELKIGDKIIKHKLEPVTHGTAKLSLAYENGFYSGDGTSLKGGKTKIYLYDNKKTLLTRFSKYMNYEDANERISLIYAKDVLQPKYFVPNSDYRVKSRLDWLSGYIDADGTLTNNNGTESIQIASINLPFLKEIMLMLQELGVHSTISMAKREGYEMLPANDGSGTFKEYWVNSVYRLLISGSQLPLLIKLGLNTSRVIPTNREYQREARQFVKVREIIDEGEIAPTYCANEPKEHKLIFNGILTGNCTEIFQNTNPNHYKIKIEFEDGTIKTFEEEDLVVVDGGITKKANKVTALDSIKGKKIFIVEKEKIDGDTAVCNLASINLSRINTKEDIERVTPIAVRMLDNVIDLNFYPLRKVKATNLKTRAIGLGVMGEAEMLANSKISWGSEEHFNKIDNIMECISYNAIKSSSLLGVEKGNYPHFIGSNWNKELMPYDFSNEDVLNLTNNTSIYTELEWKSLRSLVGKNMRNGYLMAIAPTSSISILVGTTQAIEPVYRRKWFEENLSGLIPVVAPKLSPDTWEYYTPSFEIDQLKVIKAGAIRQKWIDQGQSLNIFMSLDKASGKYLHEIYTLAWRLGLKSTYYLRSQSPEAKNDVEDRSLECSGCQ